MRRVFAVVLIALGVCILAMAPLFRWWVAESMMRTPMDYFNDEVVHEAQGASYFSAEDLELVEGATVQANTTLRADVAASSAEEEVVVWDQFTWVTDAETDYAISSSTRRVGHDRVTGEAVEGYDAAVDEESASQSGQAYKLPFLPEERDYEFYDTNTRQTLEFEFDGVETIEGTVEGETMLVEALRFVQHVEETAVGERELPAELLDIDEAGDVDTTEMFELTRTYLFDPVTGSPLRQTEDQRLVAQADTGEELLLFEGELVWTQETTDWYMDNAAQGMTMIPLARTALPLVFLTVGPLLILLGAVLHRTGRPRPVAEPAAAPSAPARV